MTNYYVATEDGEHFTVFEETELIFEALASYYQAIIDGPEDIYEEIEFGYYKPIEDGYDEDDYELEPILFHEFTTN